MMTYTKMICPACSEDKAVGLYLIPDHEYNLNFRAEYADCASCRSLYQTPMPDMNQLSAFYPENYHSFSKKSIILEFRHRLRLNRLKSLLRNEEATLLDYGCGGGSFILTAAKHMSKTRFFGYEIDRQKKREDLLDGRVTIIRGSFDDLMAELPPCDLVTMNHVIEHLPDPFAVISSLYENLNDHGVLEGQTPATDSLEHGIFRTKWSGFHAPRHTVIFSKKGLQRLLQRANFTQSKITPAFNPAGIAVSLASVPHGDGPGRIDRNNKTWLLFLGMAALLYPLDLLSGKPGMINFVAEKVPYGQ